MSPKLTREYMKLSSITKRRILAVNIYNLYVSNMKKLGLTKKDVIGYDKLKCEEKLVFLRIADSVMNRNREMFEEEGL